eukprot:GFUD01016933.1.p1 GENE.GFUD01016933.1~~GFUD01016933.1.p1  ORF type:complete len:656 (-),score=255.71 GFUD01016933.1:58-2025(-)
MVGGSNNWLDLVRENKFKYEVAFSDLSSKEEFQVNYKRRLVEVMDSLGLMELEHLVQGLDKDEKCNFKEFSQEFYEKVLWELCGISNLSTLDNYYKSNRYARLLVNQKDPVNLIQTFYIMQEILDLDMDVSMRHIAMLGRVSALDMLVTLNMLEQTLYQDKDQDTRKDLIILGAQHCDQLFIENQFIWSLPVSHCVKLLEEIGFTSSEVGQLVMETRHELLGDMSQKIEEFDMNRETFVEVMKKRLYLLRKEGVKLGIANILGTYKFMFNWEEVVRAIDKAELGRNPCFVKFGFNNIIQVGIKNKTASTSTSRLFLVDYFAYNTLEVKKFNKMFTRIPHGKDVPLRIVVDSVMFLESLDFSKQQIERGFPIVFYSKKIIAEHIPSVEAVLGSDWMERENALCLLNYFIEVEQKFSFDLIYTGIVESYEEGLSEEFFKELPSVTQAQASTAQPKPLLASSQLSPLAGAKHRSFHTSSCLQNKEEEHKTRKIKLFHFQNPITRLKIFLKFLEVKQQWDPTLDQQQCLVGAKHAVAAITSMLEEGRWKEMRGLLSRKEFKRLQKEVETEWSDVMRQNVSLEVEEMEKVLITDITTQQIVHNKYCDIDVLVLGVKEQKVPLLMQVEVRLHREYTEGCLPDWVVTRFRIKNFDKRGQTEE